MKPFKEISEMLSVKEDVELDEGKKLTCPKCGSTDISLTPKGKEYHAKCRDCGYEWTVKR